MYCSKCGSEIVESDSFCRSCGKPIQSESGTNSAAPENLITSALRDSKLIMIVGSLIFPGLGHLLVKQFMEGARIAGFTGLTFLVMGVQSMSSDLLWGNGFRATMFIHPVRKFIILPMVYGAYIFSIVDAVRSKNRPTSTFEWRQLLEGKGLALLAPFALLVFECIQYLRYVNIVTSARW